MSYNIEWFIVYSNNGKNLGGKGMKIIGITGPSGSGKSILASALRECGISVIDADELYHSLLVPPSRCLDLIRDAFGAGIFNSDGTLDRPALARIVFSDEEKLELLNSTVLSVVIDEAKKIIENLSVQGEQVAAIDAPTLIESGFNTECDLVVSVISDPDTRADRISERDHIGHDDALRRIRAQKDDEFYKRHSDVVIFNDGDIGALTAAAEKILISVKKEHHV